MSGRTLLEGLLAFRQLDELATTPSPLQGLDARAKLLATLAFVLVVMSFDRREVAALVPFAVFPAVVATMGRVPIGWLLRKLAFVLPIALVIALPNPWLDREVVARWGGLEVTGGWLSLCSIVLRAMLAAAAALLLVAVTGFPALCHALGRLGMPQALVVQLLFLYRYLAVLAEEALRMTLARELRGGGRPLSMRQTGPLLGTLLLRTWARAERIHLAMCSRGFDGRMPSPSASRLAWRDGAWMGGWLALFALLRTQDLVHALGAAALAMAGGPR